MYRNIKYTLHQKFPLGRSVDLLWNVPLGLKVTNVHDVPYFTVFCLMSDDFTCQWTCNVCKMCTHFFILLCLMPDDFTCQGAGIYRVISGGAVLAIFGGKRQLPPIMPPKIKLSAAIFCRRRIFVSLMMLHCLLNLISSSEYEHMITK